MDYTDSNLFYQAIPEAQGETSFLAPEIPQINYDPAALPQQTFPDTPSIPPTPHTPEPPTMSAQDILDLKAQIARLEMSNKTKLNIKAPQSFKGEGLDVKPFFNRVESYFRATGNSQLANEQKIHFAVNLMEGGADYWKDLFYQQDNDAAANNRTLYATWEE